MDRAMEVAGRKPNIGAMAIALPMLLFGVIMFGFGYAGIWEMKFEQPSLIACSVAWLLTGTVTCLAALWILGSLGRRQLALRLGGTAIFTSGAILVTAAATNVLECSSPG